MIVPIHNEARWIRELLERLLAQPDVGQLIVVDDGSQDDSLAIVRQVVRTAPRTIDVTVIPLKPNQGKGAAVNRALSEVTRPFVIIQDADLEYDPADYHSLLEPLLAGESRVVFGSRFLGDGVISNPPTGRMRDPDLDPENDGISLPRQARDRNDDPATTGRPQDAITLHDAGNRLLSWFTSWLFDVRLTDMNTCYKCFDSTLIPRLHCTERRFAWDPQLTAQLIRLGQGIVERPIRYRPRTVAEGKQLRWQDGFSQLRVLTREWLRWPPAWWRLVVSLIATGTLLAGLAANQLATIQRVEGKPYELTEPLRLGQVISLDRSRHCRTGVGFVVAGPYVTLPPGDYRYRATLTAPGQIQAVADAGSPTSERIDREQLLAGTAIAPLVMDVPIQRWSSETEFRVRSTTDATLCVQDQSLERRRLFPLATLIDTLIPVRTSELGLPTRE